jgi:flagellum-specific peptidoglycan hydrolase FlgJ
MKTGIEYYNDLMTFLRWQLLHKMAVGTIVMTVAIVIPFTNRQPADLQYWGEGVRPNVRRYVRLYYDDAAALWKTYHIPIWGTMAVAILESSAGQSELAIQANNHFGIEYHCCDWDGPVYYKDVGHGPSNENNGEKFTLYRFYPSVEAGYHDFGKFLQTPRYDALRRCGPYDFQRWCYALKAAGYAADKDYAQKLILLIRDYHLDELNRRRPEPVGEV